MLNWLNSIYHFILPHNCILCKSPLIESKEQLCAICQYELPYYEDIAVKNNAVSKCFWGRLELQHALALLTMNKKNNTHTLIHGIKYKNKQKLAIGLGKMLGLKMLEVESSIQFDVLIPVPLHPKKQKLRGYNQSKLIADGLASVLLIPVNDCAVIRSKHHSSQTKKSRVERWKNVNELFECISSEELTNKHVLLIDDVLTTGSTLEACGNALKSIPGIKLSIAVLAFAP